MTLNSFEEISKLEQALWPQIEPEEDVSFFHGMRKLYLLGNVKDFIPVLSLDSQKTPAVYNSGLEKSKYYQFFLAQWNYLTSGPLYVNSDLSIGD